VTKRRNTDVLAAERVDGLRFREALVGAAATFDLHITEINSLNVFPVPDGDTGTNMGLTLKSAVREALSAPDVTLAGVAKAAAQGALLGARGNSGVILSQYFRGIARSVERHSDIGASELAQALTAGSATAYKAVIRPVEGTMLTVGKDAAAAASQAAESGADLLGVITNAVTAARESVARTPDLLPVLREANVVDAGGQGLLVILDGLRAVLAGEEVGAAAAEPSIERRPVVGTPAEVRGYGYCVEFIIRGRGIDTAKVRQAVEELGSSALAVGDEQVVKVHVHTKRPGRVLEFGVGLGTLHDIKIDNMDEQHRETLLISDQARSTEPTRVLPSQREAAIQTALVAVAAGDGFAALFRNLGVATIVPGGQTMNPSTEDLLSAIQDIKADEVVVLPNNSNILLAAQQARQLTTKRVAVIPTHDMAQGVAVCLAYQADKDLATNAQAMERALRGVRTAEVTTAVRAAKVNGFNIKPGEALGLADGRLVSVRLTSADVLQDLLRHLEADQSQVLTVYYGAEVDPATARHLAESATTAYPGLESDVVEGGQPLYQFLLALE
jgi:uncharacterized protein